MRVVDFAKRLRRRYSVFLAGTYAGGALGVTSISIGEFTEGLLGGLTCLLASAEFAGRASDCRRGADGVIVVGSYFLRRLAEYAHVLCVNGAPEMGCGAVPV